MNDINEKNVNSNQTPDNDLVLTPVPTTREAAYALGLTDKDLGYAKIGNRKVLAFFRRTSREVHDCLIESYVLEIKQQARARRCQIRGISGRLIRCPEENKCAECPHYASIDKVGNQPLTFSDLDRMNEDGEVEIFDPAAPETYYEADRYSTVVNEFTQFVAQRQPECASIIPYIADKFTQREIAVLTGIPQSTVSDRSQKIRPLADEHFGTKNGQYVN